MMFKDITSITIPEGDVTKITNNISGDTLWEKKTDVNWFLWSDFRFYHTFSSYGSRLTNFTSGFTDDVYCTIVDGRVYCATKAGNSPAYVRYDISGVGNYSATTSRVDNYISKGVILGNYSSFPFNELLPVYYNNVSEALADFFE